MLVTFIISVVYFITACEGTRTAEEMYSYNIPHPKIEAFTPRGFRVSIEDSPGVRLFAFHGSVNTKLVDYEPGSYSLEAREPYKGKWVIEEKYARLHVGDKFYYWLFVIKDNLGYRLDGPCFIVEGLLPSPYDSLPSHTTQQSYPVKSDTKSPKDKGIIQNVTPPDPSHDLFLCEETILNTTQVLINIRTELDKYKKVNKLIVKDFEEYPGSKQLKLSGRIAPDGTPLSVVEAIMIEKLDFKPKISWAVRRDTSTIVFETSSVMDKYELLNLAKDKLKNSKINLS